MSISVTYQILGPVQTNCYFVKNNDTNEVIIVDPADRADVIDKIITKYEFKPVAILLTHGHADHIMAVPAVKKTYDIPVYAHKDEQQVIENPAVNLSGMMGGSITLSDVTYVNDGDELTLGGMKFKVIHTPGHTAGGACYYFEEEGILVAGDTLFEGSVGRTDFPTGSMSTLVRSIKEKLFLLPNDTLVLPGHGGQTSIEYEKMNNPFL